MMSRLGLLGGMFDPVHKAHVAAARYALDSLQLDSIKMLPCNVPNHRAASATAAKHRLAMLNLALQAEPLIEADELEIRRGGVSYSVDTLQHFHSAGTHEQLVFILGMDALNLLPNWQRWQEMFEYSHFFVLGREAQRVAAESAQLLELSRRLVSDPARLFDSKSGNVYIAEEFDLDGSSTLVRERLMQNSGLQDLLEPAVLQYIKDNNLYGVE